MAQRPPNYLDQFVAATPQQQEAMAQGQTPPKADTRSRYDRMRDEQKAGWEERRRKKAAAQQAGRQSQPPKPGWGDVTYKMKQTEEMRRKYGGKAGASGGKYKAYEKKPKT